MMPRSDPPPPGWYPDPEGGSRLRWWHGTDWSDRYRPPPTPSELHRAATARDSAAHGTAPISAAGGPRRGLARAEVDEIVAQVRQIARSEVDRAAEQFEQRTRAAARELQPLVSQYTNRIIRWVRIALVVLVLAVIVWVVFQAIAQVTFLEWLGDRLDSLTD